jgi:hypothetical protein
MKKLSLLFLGMAVMLVLSLTALGSDTLKFTGAQTSDGVYGTGIYYGTLNGTPMDFMCDDASHTISAGQSWQVTEYTLAQMIAGGSTGPASYVGWNSTYGGSSDPTEAYTMEAYLESLMIWGGGSVTDPNGISEAAWTLLDSGYTAPTGSDYSFWIGKAYAAYLGGYTGTNVTFYVPTTGSVGQEFSSATPEPISMALMGTFLTLAGLGLGKKKLLS